MEGLEADTDHNSNNPALSAHHRVLNNNLDGDAQTVASATRLLNARNLWRRSTSARAGDVEASI